jgi:hypothetical protein
MMGNLDDPAVLLPLIFTGLMILAMLLYVVLDGYDLGVGVLLLAYVSVLFHLARKGGATVAAPITAPRGEPDET